MKARTLLAALFLTVGVSGAMAQSDNCNTNSSISHEAVKSKNYQDAYAPNKAVMEECPTLRYYTFTDATEILQNFLKGISDRNSADYKKYFDELMNAHDLKMKYIPEFATKMKGVPTVAASLAAKAQDYLTYAPSPNVVTAYDWFKQSISEEKAESKASVLVNFMSLSQQRVKADNGFTDTFFQDYLDLTALVDDAIKTETDAKKKTNLENVKENLVALFINSGVADCESLQKIYGPKVEENQNNQEFLAKTVSILSLMKCTESDAYFQASYYMYKINPTSDAAVGCGWMSYKKGDYDAAVNYFNEALELETENSKKAEIAYVAAASLVQVKKYSQARSYCQKAVSFRDDYGAPLILMAQCYAASPNWSDEAALNRCTYFLAIDKLQRARSVDPSCADEANKLISSYSAYTPKAEDLFMLGINKGDQVKIGGWIGESTTVR